MKKNILKLLTLIVLISSCSTKLQEEDNKTKKESLNQMELQENLEWEELETFITHFNDTTDLETGKKSIIEFLSKNSPNFDTEFLNNLEISDFKKELLDWVSVPLTTETPNPSIKSLYFGLFTTPDKELTGQLDEIKVLYVAGSSVSPLDDPDDWAVEPEYLPEARYFVPNEFEQIELELKKYKNTSEVEQIIYNGLINLVLVNCKSELKTLLKERSLHIGSGFDEGDAFYLGKI